MHPYAFYCLCGRREIPSILILVLWFNLNQSYRDTIGNIIRYSTPLLSFNGCFFSEEWQKNPVFQWKLEQGKELTHFPFHFFAVPSSFEISVVRITTMGQVHLHNPDPHVIFNKRPGPQIQSYLLLQIFWRCPFLISPDL